MKIKIIALLAIILTLSATGVSYAEYKAGEKNYQLNTFNYENIWLETKGAGVRVCIVDTGFTNFDEAFLPRVSQGYSVLEDGSTYDNNGHGTAIAYVIGSPTNSTTGVVGLAPEVEIVPIKVMDENGMVSANNTAKGLSWALTHNCDIINVSLTGEQDSELLRTVVQAIVDKNIPLVASAGNGYGNGNPLPFPASYPGVIAVSAVGRAYELTEYANRGSYLSYVELGNSILAPNLEKGLYLWSGSSFATAIVSGKIALVKALYPKITLEELRYFLSVTAVDLESTNFDASTGYGIINLDKALGLLKSKYNVLEKIEVSAKTGLVSIKYQYPIEMEEEIAVYTDGKKSEFQIKEKSIILKARFAKNINITSSNPYYQIESKKLDYSQLATLSWMDGKIVVKNLPKNSELILYKGNNKLSKIVCDYECAFNPKSANRVKIINKLYTKYISLPKR